jgi:hypothetical protein
MVPSAGPGIPAAGLGLQVGGETSKAGERLPDGNRPATGPGCYAHLTPAALKDAVRGQLKAPESLAYGPWLGALGGTRIPSLLTPKMEISWAR